MEKTEKEKALEIAALMEDGKGQDVTVIDVSKLNSWTDYFVITTVTSSAHWQGLYKSIKDYAAKNDMEIHPIQPGIPCHLADRQRVVNAAVGGLIGEIRQQMQGGSILLGVLDGL